MGITESECACLVATNISDTTQVLQSVELADDDHALDHGLHSDRHGVSEDSDERFWDRSDTWGRVRNLAKVWGGEEMCAPRAIA